MIVFAISFLFTIFAVNLEATNNSILPKLDECSSNRTNNLLTFIEKVREEKDFETLVLYMNEHSKFDKSCLIEELLSRVQLPVVLINRETSYEYREKFNSEILLVRLFSMSIGNELFQEFQAFPVRTNFRVLYIFENESLNAAVDIFQQYCNSTHNYQIVNMLAITANIGITMTYLRCRHLDAFDVEFKQYTEPSTVLYEDRLRDLGGIKIRTLEDLLEPRTMIDHDKHGNRKLSGYVGKLLRAFVRKHNATLKSIYELPANKTVFYKDIQNITRDGLLDVGATLIVPLSTENLNDLTYPYELSKYCLMIPISPDIPLQQLFTHIVRPSIFMALLALMLIFGFLLTFIMQDGRLNFRGVLLNDRSLRGLLGQAFPMPKRSPKRLKCVLVLICFTSVIVNTMYVAYLQAFLAHPPTEPPLLTMNDIVAARKLILVAREELFIFRNVPKLEMEHYCYLFEIIDEFHEFTKRRARLDTNYVYPASFARWLVFNEQQQLFARKMFFYHTDICMVPLMLLHLPILKNSRYRDAIERVMLQIRDSGLLQEWMSWNFYDMLRLNRTSLEDLSHPNLYGIALGVHDLYWIWCMYFLGIGFSLLWFCWELLIWRWRKHQCQKKVTSTCKSPFEWVE